MTQTMFQGCDFISESTMTQTINKLTGQELLDYVEANTAQMTKTQLCYFCGYAPMIDGVTKYKFTEFFEAILDARKANGEYNEVNSCDWYEDVLDDKGRELYDQIEDMCPEFTKLDAEQCQDFMDELSEHGITTAEQFESAYYYHNDSWNAESHFAEYITTGICCVDLPHYVVIDWQATWDCNLSYDFFTIEFDGETYFFTNNF